MTYDSWKTTEPDREPAPGEHRPYDEACDCAECMDNRYPEEEPCLSVCHPRVTQGVSNQ